MPMAMHFPLKYIVLFTSKHHSPSPLPPLKCLESFALVIHSKTGSNVIWGLYNLRVSECCLTSMPGEPRGNILKGTRWKWKWELYRSEGIILLSNQQCSDTCKMLSWNGVWGWSHLKAPAYNYVVYNCICFS